MEAAEPQSTIFEILKDCVAYQVLQVSKEQQKSGPRNPKRTRRPINPAEIKPNEDQELAEDLDEFVLYLSQEIYQLLPANLESNPETVDSTAQNPTGTEETALETLLETLAVPPTFTETLTTYSLASTPEAASELFHSILNTFAAEHKTQQALNTRDVVDESVPPPGGWKSTRTTECEICIRVVPLTYHHLIPRSTHQKVLKRKWHPETRLNSVAWLCR